MKKVLFILLAIMPSHVFADFIHPMEFDGSDAQKKRVIEIVKARVKKDYCEGPIDMCQDTTLRMMERQNLDAFKQATAATNRKIMDRVIKDYCAGAVDMCNYSTIMMMYTQNLQASQKKLSW
ncbi:hypothetical protein ACVBIO_20720 [Shewanella sp. 0m-8]